MSDASQSHWRVVQSPGPEWNAAERDLLRQGRKLHAFARSGWAEYSTDASPTLLLLRAEGSEEWTSAVGVQRFRSRALPGHVLFRAERVGSTLDDSEHRAFAEALVALVGSTPRVLRATVELTDVGSAALERTGQIYRAAGFAQQPATRSWRDTLVVDLSGAEDDILATFSQKPRRDLRKVSRLPIEIRPIANTECFPRLDALIRLTYARTGATSPTVSWASLVEISRAAPDTMRVIGLFRTDTTGCDSLVAFVVGIAHGDHATYEIGASERQPDLNVPLLTPLLWDLMKWARTLGAGWFDLGGISAGTLASDDPLGGISDFKRLLSNVEVQIGADWVLEPNPLRARIANLVSRLAR